MNRTRWLVVAATVVAAAVGTLGAGFTLSFPMVAIAAAVLAGALYYYRAEPNFALCLTALLQIVLFSTAFALLTYLAARVGGPLADRRLAAWDAALGFDVRRLVAWQSAHPRIGNLLNLAYDSMFLQTALVVALLGLRGDRRLETFVLRMMLAGLVTLGLFLLFPAEGPFAAYGFAPSPVQSRYLEHLHTLRSGARNAFSFSEVEGLITFPSFHTIWAMLLAIACFRVRLVRGLAAALNAAVVLSTLTTGWHYLSDVLAGAMVCIAVCLLVRDASEPAGQRATRRSAEWYAWWKHPKVFPVGNKS